MVVSALCIAQIRHDIHSVPIIIFHQKTAVPTESVALVQIRRSATVTDRRGRIQYRIPQ
jgi:hypothetical protein